MLVLKDMRRLKTLEKNRAGDVIGEVAYQSDFSAKFLGKGNKVNPQYILDFNTQQILGESFAKPRSQITVNFNRSNLPCFFNQGRRQRRLSWADLNNSITRSGSNRSDDPGNDGGVVKEILTKPFTRNMGCRVRDRRV